VGGRLSKFVNFWQNQVKESWVNKIVSEGYSLEFVRRPSFVAVKETKVSKLEHVKVIQHEVAELLRKQAIELVPVAQEKAGFYSTFFVVPKKSGELRPILNLRHLNRFLAKKHFKMETLQAIIKAVQPNDWMVSLDLKDAYLHIPIQYDSRKYLRFKIQGQAYQFKVLPFGLTSSPRIFTKVLAPLAAIARLENIHVFPYLDDWLLKDTQQAAVNLKLQRLMTLLKEAGFIINLKKSQTNVSQNLVFVGGHFQTAKNVVTCPPDRIAILQECLQKFQVGLQVPARLFLRLLGLMASMISVVKHCRLFMRPIQMYLMACWDLKSKDIDAPVLVNQELLPHLEWWGNPQNVLVGMPLNPLSTQEVVTTDASKLVGWGGHFKSMDVQGKWDMEEAQLHINVLELIAVVKTLNHFKEWLIGKTVLVRCDNVTVVTYINKQGGTRSPSLCMRVWKLLMWARNLNIELRAEHIPGEMNERADRLSRWTVSPLEWQLNRQVARLIFQVMGEPLIDLFATSQNRQVPVYCSRFQEAEAFHADSLSMSWENIYGFAFPPICLIPAVLERVEKFQCTVILIAPMWPRRSWFPRVLDLLVEAPLVLPNQVDLLTQLKGQLHHPCPERMMLVAWKLSGNRSYRRDFQRRLSAQCRPQSEIPRPGCTTNCGRFLCVGVVNGSYVLAQHL
jgi:ribonuclease HI